MPTWMNDILGWIQFGTAVLVFATMLVSALTAFLAKKGIMNQAQVDEAKSEEGKAKNMANAVAKAIDEVKKIDPAIGKLATGVVLDNINGEKEFLDTFLRERNLNQPQ